MSIRTFVGIALPDDVKDDLSRMFAGVPGARWLDDDQIHLTLRFVGEVDGVVFRELLSTLGRVDKEGFELALKGVGHFPPRGMPRVLWVGVEPVPALLDLRAAVDRACVRAGAEPERRKYHPHVTIARLNGAPDARLGRFMAEYALYRSRPFDVTEFHVYSSKLLPKGPVYDIEATYELGAFPGEGWEEE